ncbi:MAG TPA: M43 family zinc metalloprotease [Longimicrobium sp.]|nr:M43 family zinc metalloprotease [Longimicrobium sp.]
MILSLRFARAALLAALLAAPAAAQRPPPRPDVRVAQATPEYVLRMHAIRVRNTDGSQATDISPAQVQQWVQKTNQVLTASGAGIRLQWDPSPTGPDWETLDNTTINHAGFGNAQATAAANAVAAKYPGKLVVFFRRDAGNGPNPNTGNGWSDDPASGVLFIAMPGFAQTTVVGDVTPGTADGETSVQNIWQLAHDFGHFLSLDHTFPGSTDEGTNTVAKAAAYIRNNGGAQGALDGDGIADTPAEAGTGFFATQGWTLCGGHDPYTISGTRTNGQPFTYEYRPARNNIMSYFACEPMRFTPGQVARMRQALQHPNRVMLVQAPCPPDFAQVPASAFQTCFDYWARRGMWPVSLASNRIGSATFFAGSMQAGADRPVRTMMTQAQFQEAFNTFKTRNFRPDRIHVLSTPDGPRFNVIWTPVDGQFEVRADLTTEQFGTTWTQMRAAGFVNTDLAGYATAGGTRFAGVWVKRATQGDASYGDMTAAAYQQRFDQMWAQGFRPVRLSVYNVGAETRYAAVWEKVPGSWAQRFGMTAAQFQAEYDTRAAAGFRLHQVTPLGDRFAATWFKP